MQLPTNLAQSEKHFTQTLHTQRELPILIEEGANTKEKLMQIQSSITPHLEVFHKEKMYAETILKKDSNLSTLDGLIDLVVNIAIQHKSLEIALENWDATLKILLEVNKTFLAKHGITLQNPFTSVSKWGRNKQRGIYIIGGVISKGGDM